MSRSRQSALHLQSKPSCTWSAKALAVYGLVDTVLHGFATAGHLIEEVSYRD